MRANLQKLAKLMVPMSDDRARELLQGDTPDEQQVKEFVALECDSHDEFWLRSAAIQSPYNNLRVIDRVTITS